MPDFTVVVVEKGSEIGAHILSGVVIDPIGLDKLLPGWRDDADAPLKIAGHGRPLLPARPLRRRPAAQRADAAADEQPRQFRRLARQCLPLAGAKAEELGVEIYPGFAASEVLYGDNGEVLGVATGDMGVGRDGKPKDSFTRGMELRGKYTLFAEGARGSLSKQLIARYKLDAGGAAEIRHRHQGAVAGRPGQARPRPRKAFLRLAARRFGTGGGSFLYHIDDNQVAVGFVLHLNYNNPTLSPFDEFQRCKTASADPRHFCRRQAHRLWRPRHHRRRLAIRAQARLSPAARCSAAPPASSTSPA